MQTIPESNKHATLKEHQMALFSLLREFDRICGLHHIRYSLFAGTLLGAVRHGGFIPWDDDLDVIMLREDYDRFMEVAVQELDSNIFFLQKEFSGHWPMFFSKLRLNGTTCLEKYHPKDSECHQGVYIDIFPCDNAAKSLLGQKIQFYASKVVIAKSLGRRGYDTDSKKKKFFIGVCRFLPRTPFLWITKGRKFDTGVVHSFFGGASGFEKNIYPRSYFDTTIPMVFEQGEFPVSSKYDRLLTTLYGNYMELPPPEKRMCKQHALLVDLNHSYEEYVHYRDDMEFDIYTRSIR